MNRSNVLIITATSHLAPMNIPVSKVEFRSMPTNTQTIWFDLGRSAMAGWCYPLDIGDGKEDIYIENLSQINFYFESSSDKIALIYEVEQ